MKKAIVIALVVFTAGLVFSSCRTHKGCEGVHADKQQVEQTGQHA